MRAMLNPASANLQQSARDLGVLSVTSLNRLARQLLEGHFPDILVEGEISNLTVPASGHWYLTLKDSGAQLRCAMFRQRNQRLRFTPRNGMQVLVRGRLSLYEGRGDYQLIAEDMEEAGAGALRRAFEVLKAQLQSEGLFEAHHKRPITPPYRHIGVITSGSGAAFHDIITVFRRRAPRTRITLLPVLVQGEEAPAALCHALETANRLAGVLGLEALIVGRGGGSLEDLQAFNHEAVARAVFASELPVVSAVGHEIDFTICDFVADLRAATPTAAAELLSEDQQAQMAHVLQFQGRLRQAVQRRLQRQAERLDAVRRQLRHPGRRLQAHAQTLDLLNARLLRAWHTRGQQHVSRLQALQRSLTMVSPRHRVRLAVGRNQDLRNRLGMAVRQRLKDHQTRLATLVRALNAVSPLQVLARGYSISYGADQTVVRDAVQVAIGSQLTTRVHRGVLVSTVTEILPTPKDSS